MLRLRLRTACHRGWHFIETLHAAFGAYIFAVFTCACTSGGTTRLVRRMLRCRGLDLAAAWTVKMPENYPPLGGTSGSAYQIELKEDRPV